MSSYEDSDDYRRDRRHRSRRSRRARYGPTFRRGDRVQFKQKIRSRSDRRSYSVWVPATVEAVTDGMYDEPTYTVHLTETGQTKPYIGGDELRFERLTKEDESRLEIKELQKQLEAERRVRGLLEAKSIRNQNGMVRGASAEPGIRRGRRKHVRSYSARNLSPELARSRPPPGRQRALSVDRVDTYAQTAGGYGNPGMQKASSVPPNNYTWPQFIADLTHAVYYRSNRNGPEIPTSGRDHRDDEEDALSVVAQDVRRAPKEIIQSNFLEDESKVEMEEYDKPLHDDYDAPPTDTRRIVADLKQGGDGYADDLQARAPSPERDEREMRDERRSRGVERNTGQSLINVYVGGRGDVYTQH